MTNPNRALREQASPMPSGWQSISIPRRRFLQTAGILAGAHMTSSLLADERPTVTEPRATSGDKRFEPDWQKRMTLTVGPKKADLVGANEKVIQAAVDYVARWGGGTVHVLPGLYKLRNAVYLRSGVRIAGSGEDSVLIKEPSTTSTLSADSDWYDQEITLDDASGFRVGDGVCIRAKNTNNGSENVVKRTLIAQSGNRFKLDRALRKNFWTSGSAAASTLFALFDGEEVGDIAIEYITLDGDKANNANLDGNYAGCIFLQDCQDVAIRDVTARNYNGDGISWQICHDVVVEHCYSHDNVGLGLHPGSGSQRPLIRENRINQNQIGIFFCWGVKYGLAEKNTIDGNLQCGVSIGHRDTDNLIRDNDIFHSGQTGVLFRPERGKAFAPHRNRLEANRIVNSGEEQGVAVDVQGETESITIARNELKESRGPQQRIGVRIGEDARDVRLEDNRIEGFAVNVAGGQGGE